MDRAATLSWASTISFRINGDAKTFDENDAVIAGIHPVQDDQGRQKLVMGIARMREGKFIAMTKYAHCRAHKMADRHVTDRQRRPESDDRP